MRRSSLFSKLLVGLALLSLASCGKKSPTAPGTGGISTIPTETRAGTVQTTPGSALHANELRVLSFTDSARVDSSGHFSVPAPIANRYQVLFFTPRSISAEPVYIGLYDPATRTLAANDSSTALGLTLLNPCLVDITNDQRKDYITAVLARPGYQALVEMIAQAHVANPAAALDMDANPAIFQAAVTLMQEAIAVLGSAPARGPDAAASTGPTVTDASGADIVFVNPTKVWYAAGVHPNGGDQSAIVPIERATSVVSFNWGWPPVVINEPKNTTYALGDGTFRLDLAKGLDYSKFTQVNDPAGRATILNTATGTFKIIELVAGFVPAFDAAKLVERSTRLHLSEAQIAKLSTAIAQQDYLGLFVNLCSILGSNADEVAYWIFESTGEAGATQWIQAAGGILSNFSQVMKIWGAGNSQVPFFWDLIFAPGQLTYDVTQTGGVLGTVQANDAPAAAFTVTPPAGTPSTIFTFDAGTTTDDHDAVGALQFRWDFDSDGAWDTGWSTTTTVNHQYPGRGAWTARLEARDTRGSVGSAGHLVSVNGGRATANHVKLFRDDLPWSSSAQTTVLRNLGFTEGPGANQFEILPSSAMTQTPLVPGQDLVIISNDQDQAFYDAYAANMIKFGNFVISGGSLFWEACDGGWNVGRLSVAGVILPGSVVHNYNISGMNYVVNSQLPLVAGLPAAMDHNYASHEYFTGLPMDATVYCIDNLNQPTLVEYNLGAGWILMSGQPLEHQYDRIYGSPDMEQLLPRIVAYFTGQEIRGPALRAAHPVATGQPGRPSSADRPSVAAPRTAQAVRTTARH